MQLIAVSLIGIPGAGKTTLAHKILEMSRNGSLSAGVIVISFDDYIKINFDELLDGEYKQHRESLICKIQDLIQLLRDSEHHRWSEVLSSHELQIHNQNIEPNSPTLLIIDDNMHYRSMRQRIRALCKTLQCQHFQIFMKSSLEDAKERNRERPTPVPDAILENMFNLLEPPTNPRAICIDVEDETLLEKLEDRIAQPETIEEPQPKLQQQQSILHEMDLITRKELSERIKALSEEQRAKQCSSLNRKRKQFLEDLRAQSLDTADLESLRAAFNCYLDQ